MSRPKKFIHIQGGLFTYRLKQLAGSLSQLIRLITVLKERWGNRMRLYLDKCNNNNVGVQILCVCVCVCVCVHMHQNQYPHPNTEQWRLLIQVNLVVITCYLNTNLNLRVFGLQDLAKRT